MSGPKTSRYRMTEEQRRQLREQQRIIRETQLARDKAKKMVLNFRNVASELTSAVEELEKICTESNMGASELTNILDSEKEMLKIMNQLSVSYDNQSLEYIKSNISNGENLLNSMRAKTQETRVITQRIHKEYKGVLNDIIVNSFELDFSNLGADRSIKNNEYVKKINDALAPYLNISLTTELNDKLEILKIKASEISDAGFLKNFYAIEVKPFVNECEYYREHMDEFEDLLEQYRYYIRHTSYPEIQYSFSAENMNELKDEVKRLHDLYIDQKEQEYICQTIDEVMIEMGYELIGERSVEKKNGRKFRNGLYTLEEGTAVNVTFSDSGQISMELGAIDNCDRVPTAAEASELVNDMQAFCTDYSELEKRLALRGIQTNRLSILPPSVEYAQVINASEYELKREPEVYKSGKKNTAKKTRYMKEG